MKRYCKRGHDTDVCGRTANRSCRACKVQDDAARYRRQGRHNAVRQRRGRIRQGILNLPPESPGAGHPCDCCGRPIPATPSADHCHRTGQFRGWVCRRCNTGLGYIEQEGWLVQARDYLRARR